MKQLTFGRALVIVAVAITMVVFAMQWHTLLAMPTLERLGLLKTRFSMAAVGATIFTDIAALLVLALCVSVHVTGDLSLVHLAKLIFGLGALLFVPLFFVFVGISIDLKVFADSIATKFPFVLAIVTGLFLGKFCAAAATRLQQGYTWPEGLTLWSLSLPQLAATLAAAITAYKTVDAAGVRLIDDTVVNAVIVLMTVTAILGPVLTQRFGQRVAPARTAPLAEQQSA